MVIDSSLHDSARKRAGSWRWLVCGVAIHACGPSFEAIQEGDLRFAHCDRLDIDPNISPSHRLHCWREWRRVYTYGQTRDRVEYAQRRIAEVVSGDTEPPFELPLGPHADPRPPRPAPIPDPTSPIEPIESAPPGPESGGPGDPTAPLGAASAKVGDGEAECRARCEADRSGCMPGCETKPTGCTPCEPSFEACLEICGSAR